MVAFEDFDGQMHRHIIHLPNEDVDKILNTGIMVTVQFIMLKAERAMQGKLLLILTERKMRKTAYGKTERIVKNKLLEYRIQAKLKKLAKHIITHTPQLKKTKDTAVKLTLHRFQSILPIMCTMHITRKQLTKIFSVNTKSILITVKSPKKNPGFGNLYCQITVQTNFPPKCLKRTFKMPHMPK